MELEKLRFEIINEVREREEMERLYEEVWKGKS